MKLISIRGENCVEARVRVIKRIAKTIATTVMDRCGYVGENGLGYLRIRMRWK